MEPRPSPRAAPAAPAANAPEVNAPAQVPYDPYTAPEAQAMAGGYAAPGPGPAPGFGVPPNGPPGGQGTTRLGPLADEPVYYPNQNLPPNRPAYDPTRMEPRADYALHPVGRVPPDHTPLNLRPAPPPIPTMEVPDDRGNTFRYILAGAIGLVAVAALVLAFLAFANGGFGLFDDDPAPTEPAIVAGDASSDPAAAASDAGAASVPAVTDGEASTAAAASVAGVAPPAASEAPAAGDAAPSDAANTGATESAAASTPADEEPAVDASAEPDASAEGDVAATDADASAAPDDESGSSPSPASEGGEVAAAIGDFLPPSDELPAGFDAPSDEGERSLEEVAATFVGVDEDATAAQADLEEWGWEANEFITYDAAPQPANEDINRYAVSVHQFGTADGATDALPAFVEAFGIQPLELTAEQQVGDEVVAMQTTNDDGNLAVLYVRTGQYILKIDAASITGDPLPAALTLAEQLVGPADGGDAAPADEGTTEEEDASAPPAL